MPRIPATVLLLAAAAQAQTRYTVTDLGEAVPTAGSYAFAINQAGIVAGDAPQDPTCNPCHTHAFEMINGVLTDLGVPPGTGPDSETANLNLSGQLVGRGVQNGYYIPILYLPQAAYGAPAGWTILPQFTGGLQSQAWSINDAGNIAGESRLAGSLGPHPVIWHPTGAGTWTIQDLGTLGGQYGRARAINNQGQVTGQASAVGGNLAPFIWLPAPAYGLPAGITALDAAGNSGDMWSINEQGQIAGGEYPLAAIWLPAAAFGQPAGLTRIVPSNLGILNFAGLSALNTHGVAVGQVGVVIGTVTYYHGWVWDRGQTALLEDQLQPAHSWTIIDAHGVNESGLIAATGYAVNPAQSHALILTPVAPCYANCDGSTTAPILNIADFVCFQAEFAAGDTRADCDHSTSPPILSIADFVCFQQAFAAGCP
jgi:uncharacterized membrane protein